ncbi:MAG TPA: desulfoferrodoxin [Candidatus Pacearchaeota archaeon]|nr:desulfoferrodoxin [Candidatus Pacearchaeota archaeon]HQI74625.1 desulfoferrodoxin [Candidatus Pacearchaeota archaeon]
MAQLKKIYKCSICGNVIEVLHEGAGTLVCCGKDMELLEEKVLEEGKEKHVPVAEKGETGLKIKVGSVPHPMEEKHFIEWIECMDCGCRKFLKPGDAPETEFCCSCGCSGKARIYCNIHGVWTN